MSLTLPLACGRTASCTAAAGCSYRHPKAVCRHQARRSSCSELARHYQNVATKRRSPCQALGRADEPDSQLGAAPDCRAFQGMQEEGYAAQQTERVAKQQLAPNQLDTNRTLQVSFTCNKCGGRTERLVNPLAWQKGTVFLQCAECSVWHNVKDNLQLIDEVRFNENEE